MLAYTLCIYSTVCLCFTLFDKDTLGTYTFPISFYSISCENVKLSSKGVVIANLVEKKGLCVYNAQNIISYFFFN